ncbi:MAG TPA: hypothetical protein VFP55_06130 [Solirubrobacteraceae bacterium]|nr:hypothetical protein [Solirubrobacteraceae bacterium]
MSGKLRVIDAGWVGAVRSQALWHGIADAMEPGDEPVLSFCRPAEPYVCLGYHRRLDELDLASCAQLGLPILRRQIGGGPVYLDRDQLFFQLSLPLASAPPGPSRLYAALLEPAAEALRACGVAAAVSGANDLVANGMKVSGTGAGQIGGGVVIVGNVMFAFPHERMAGVLRVPDERMRAELLRLMQAHVAPLPELEESAVKLALTAAYARALGRVASSSQASSAEEEAIAGWERKLTTAAFIAGPQLPAPQGRQVKIRAGVWVYDGGDEGLRVRATVEAGLVSAARIEAPRLGPTAGRISRALVGAAATVEALQSRLERFGNDGARVLAALQPGLVVR